MDVSKVRPCGPWVLVKMDLPEKTTKGGIYVPDGNLLERLGRATGIVLAHGPGFYLNGKKAKKRHAPVGVEVGETVFFRGHLGSANKPFGLLDRQHCLLHGQDIEGILEEGDLDLALPYDN